jgi:class 3 adenylate cyclase
MTPVDPLGIKRRLTCILAADAVGYSSHMARDEEGTVRVLSAHRAVIDGIIAFHGGRIVGTAGDSVLAEFGSAVEAVRSAVEIQEALKTRNDSLPDESRLQFRVGVNLGDVVVKNDDLLGDGVNVASRLETIADPGGICISSSVYDQITGKLDLGFQDIGEQSLKNISRPIRAYRVSGAGGAGRAGAAPSAARPSRGAAPWIIGAAAAIAIAAFASWQAGWLRPGAADTGTSRAAPAGPMNTPAAAVDAEVQRLRSDAEALKKQAESELAKARADADADRAARLKADSEATAARIRAQAEADAARIRSQAEAAAARTRSDGSQKVNVASTPAAAPAAAAGTTRSETDAKAVEARAPAPQPAASVPVARSRFDGNWSVAVACSNTADGALGYHLEFTAQVKDGVLHGEKGIEGSPGSIRLDGPIRSDGSATLSARGTTSDAKFSVNAVAKGSPYAYHVDATFDDARGSGKRVELRPCELHFTRL